MNSARPSLLLNAKAALVATSVTAMVLASLEIGCHGIVSRGPLWDSASLALAGVWSVSVWFGLALLPAALLILVASVTRIDARQLTSIGTGFLLGRGESTVSVVLLGFALAVVPLVLEGPMTDLAVGQQMPGMMGGIGADVVSLLMAFIAHRTTAKLAPSKATVPALAGLVLLLFAYLRLDNISVMAPFRLAPAALGVCFVGVVLMCGTLKLDGRWRGLPLLVIAICLLSLVFSLFTYEARSPTHAALSKETYLHHAALSLLWLATDFDGDGESSLLGGPDCAPWDSDISAHATPDLDTAVAENCRWNEVRSAEEEPPRSVKIRTPMQLPEAKGRNLILITVDTLRADHVGLRWEGRPLTPNLDRFFEGADVFSRAYSAATHTEEALPSLLSGRYPPTWGHLGLADGLAGVLRAQGYLTVAVQSLPNLQPNLVAGFEFVDAEIGTKNTSWTSVTAFESVFRAVNVLRTRDEQRPLFLWVHILDPHAYYVPESELAAWLGNDSLLAHYRHEVHRTDKALGQLFLALEDMGYFDNSLVAFTSDHGEAFGEHGKFTHVWEAYEEVIKVPLAMRFPASPGKKSDDVVSLVDVAPMALDWLGVPDASFRDGRRSLDQKAPVFESSTYQGQALHLAIVDQDRKLIVDLLRNVYEVYDLREDPKERFNLAGSSLEGLEQLESSLWGWWGARQAMPN